jgi:hypothetical protein
LLNINALMFKKGVVYHKQNPVFKLRIIELYLF